MKIDRRCFLSLGVGAGAGIALSPLPWKITDDLSIWTQNWSWTPVPATGEFTTVNTICTLCPGGCGISVKKVDNRAIKIEGMTDHPVNGGGICSLGLSGLQLLYGPTRIKTPLKRTGERGSGQWTAISWDQAITEVAEKLNALRTSGSPQSVACISGSTSSTVSRLINRFMTAYGSPNSLTVPNFIDSYRATLQLMNGVAANPGFDLEHAGYILSFGSGLLDGWGSPIRTFKANSGWKKSKVKLVQIETRLSRTAAKADVWITINPGTEADLALGIAHVIIKESLFKADFVQNYASNFNEQFRKLILDNYSPETVSKTTGVDSASIIMIAREFAKAKNPLAVSGRGQGNIPGGMNEFLAVHALNALVGAINREGGIWAVADIPVSDWPAVQQDSTATTGSKQPRLDNAGTPAFPVAMSLLNQFPSAVSSGKPYPVQALLMVESNPVFTLADSEATRNALNKIPFIVSFSSFMDESAALSDLVLPNHVYLERMEDVATAAGFNRPLLGLSKPVVKPQLDTRHVGDAFILLAQALGGAIADAFPWDSFENCLEETLGDQLETLREKSFVVDEGFQPDSWETAFHTPSEKFEFIPTALAAKKPFAPINPEGDASAFPVILLPYDTMRISSGFIGNPPFLTKTIEDTVLKGAHGLIEINPKTAQTFGLKEGNMAMLQTPKGQAPVQVHIDDGIMPGVIALPRGLGHVAYDSYLAGKGVNINRLIGSVPDPVSGLDAAWGIRAKLSKA
ncbi:MAG: menaquinone reductase molybdopterin-binding-like subunit QrcB [Desulfatirhabdiaceae bacterium]